MFTEKERKNNLERGNMKNEVSVTRITELNKEYFAPLFPEEVLNNDDLMLLGAVSDDGQACSALAVGIDGGMAYIEWLYTDPAMREQGAASAMLDMLFALLHDIGLDGIEVFYPYGEWEMDELLGRFGFLVGDENCMYRVPTGDQAYSAANVSLRREIEQESQDRERLGGISRR